MNPAKIAEAPAFSVEVFNRQSTRRIKLAVWRKVLQTLLRMAEDPPKRGRIAVHFINAGEMAAINEKFLRHFGSTDVITFDYRENAGSDEWCGEIFISVDDAVACAPRFGVSWQLESARYLVHGVLHLEGYDDRSRAACQEMKKMENRRLKRLSPLFDWGKLDPVQNAARRK